MRTKEICAAAVAMAFMCGAATSVVAAKRQPAQSGLTAIQVDCMKQYGAYEDPETHRLTLHGGNTDFQPKLDAIYACVAQKTGKPVTPFLNQTMRYLP
jgi:hypothetical protein